MNGWFYFWHAVQWFIGIRCAAMAIFWGGFGSLSAVSGLFALAWHMINCHEDGCWRPGKYPTQEENGHHFKRCRRHHLERHGTDALQTSPVQEVPVPAPA